MLVEQEKTIASLFKIGTGPTVDITMIGEDQLFAILVPLIQLANKERLSEAIQVGKVGIFTEKVVTDDHPHRLFRIAWQLQEQIKKLLRSRFATLMIQRQIYPTSMTLPHKLLHHLFSSDPSSCQPHPLSLLSKSI